MKFLPTTFHLGAAGALLLGVASPIYAQAPERGDIWARLSAMDKDEDGKVSKAEFTGPARVWDRLDRNGDGFATKAEASAMRGGRSGREGRGGGGEAPKVGDPAPAVKARALKGGEEVDLASPEKITVLVFGSHT